MFGPDRMPTYEGVSRQDVSRGTEADDDDLGARKATLKDRVSPRAAHAVDRWVDEQMFEEDVRAVLQLMRPNRRERLMGWAEHRTGGDGFRVTVSWDESFAREGDESPAPLAQRERLLNLPRMTEVLASILIGSARADMDASADEECDAYLAVLGELARRVEDLRACFA